MDLEREEELREKAGAYHSEEESEDEEMQEIRQLASQIRQKRKLKILASKEKDIPGPRIPRTAKKVSLSVQHSYFCMFKLGWGNKLIMMIIAI